MSKFATVKRSSSSWDRFKTLKFSGSILDSSIILPVRIFLTCLFSSSCTEINAVSVADLEQLSGFVLKI